MGMDVPHEHTHPAPEAESPDARTDEQEHAGGRTASTPVAVIASIATIVACLFIVVLALVVAAYQLA